MQLDYLVEYQPGSWECSYLQVAPRPSCTAPLTTKNISKIWMHQHRNPLPYEFLMQSQPTILQGPNHEEGRFLILFVDYSNTTISHSLGEHPYHNP